jgi:ABC-type multidrug transport system fused ATPase/permease subunit
MIRDLRYFVSKLPRRYKIGLAILMLVNLFVGLLDSLGLALLMPMVSIISGLDLAEGTDNAMLNWGESIFSWLGHDFTLAWILTFMISTQLVRAGGIFVRFWLTALFKSSFEKQVRGRVIRAYLGANSEYQQTQRLGQMLNIQSTETGRAGGAYNSLGHLSASLAGIFVYLIFALFVSWQLSLAAITATVLMAFVFDRIIKYSRRLGVDLSKALSRMNSELAEFFYGSKFVKSSSLDGYVSARAVSSAEIVRRVNTKIGMAQGYLNSLTELFFVIALILSLIVGSWVFNLATGQIALFAILFFRVFQQAKVLQANIQGFSENIPAFEAVHEVEKEALAESETPKELAFETFDDAIRLENISFDYRNGKRVLSDVNIEIPRGSVVSIVGPSGVGKSTIIDLIAGMLQPKSGSVLLDDVDLNSLNSSSWRKNIAYVTQEPFLFNNTISNNIAWGFEEYDQGDVVEAALLAGADEFIHHLRDGYETEVGDRGARISGGQRQRICLARAFFRSPKLLILDEATSELDSRSESLIKSAIDRVAGDMTILIVAHRSSIVMQSNLVYVLEEGRVVESGSPQELLASNGVFSLMRSDS